MLENPPEPSIKRYAPPSQRNRLLNRRKSGERLERINYSYGNDGEKSQLTPPTNISVLDHGEAGNNSLPNKSLHQGLIPVGGCCSSAAAQLLSERWAAAIHSYNDPSVDLSERPVMYSGASGSAWGHSKLSHQMDFLAELRRAIRNANAGTATNQS
ncbi:uncharacterized protein LOC143858387 isoform X1 [Tasmannia lanceolata]|uniref:uncharacterized protein LOC143858387 isoform X1 n=1 Tax=Tasmannia lanceolata TaxID=3420 RepID=UPI00406456F5